MDYAIRLVIAIVVFLLVMALVPVVARIFGLPLDADVLFVIRIAGALIAFFYILRGPIVPWRRPV